MESTNTAAAFSQLTHTMQAAISKLIVGQEGMVDMMLAGLLAEGHILLEGVPGVAKTLAAKVLARLIDLPYSRIQFTPDLMPSDVIGTNVFHPKTGDFQFRSGPVFSQIVLIDEINRAPAKTQAALFEVMEEKQITVDGITYPMQLPFMVIATQNPIEHEGTYRLPEAQLDRFLMKINVGYPGLNEEVEILTRYGGTSVAEQLQTLQPVIHATELTKAQAQLRQIRVTNDILRFIVRIVYETRNDKNIYIGASPRASLALMQVAKAIAVLRGRDFIIPEDVLEAMYPVLRHRITLTPEREMEGASADVVLKELVGRLEVPR